MFVWNMKLSFGERQPFRIWFDYLKTCLNNELDRKNEILSTVMRRAELIRRARGRTNEN